MLTARKENVRMNRRTFLKSGSVFAAAGMAGYAGAAGMAGKKEIKVAVVGCGGRGTGGMWKPANAQDFYKFGALGNMLQAAEILRKEGVDVTVKPVAFADYFLKKAEFAAEKFGVDKKFAFGGANGYKKAVEMPEVDLDDSKGILRQRFDQVIKSRRIRVYIKIR